MTSAPSVPPVGKIEALEAVDFLSQFAAEAGKLIVGDNEDSLGFLFVNMFKMMYQYRGPEKGKDFRFSWISYG